MARGTMRMVGWGSIINPKMLARYPITSIHMPIRCVNNTNLESLLVKEHRDVFNNVCSLANTIAALRGHTVLVVIHCEMSYSQLRATGLLQLIAEHLYIVLSKYPNIELGIENLMPMVDAEGSTCLRGGYGNDNVLIARDFRSILRTERIGTVLDTCHALGTIRFFEELDKNIGSIPEAAYGLEHYFKNNAKVCKEIHLSNAIGYGISKESHGQPFEEKDLDLLHNIINSYKVEGFKCPICIEMQEKDYNDKVNFSTTRDLVLADFPTAQKNPEEGDSIFIRR